MSRKPVPRWTSEGEPANLAAAAADALEWLRVGCKMGWSGWPGDPPSEIPQSEARRRLAYCTARLAAALRSEFATEPDASEKEKPD